jgi:GNAT superfamily N-acetyltransferase
VVEDFSADLLDRIRAELPQDLDPVEYRARRSDSKNVAVYVEHRGRIVASSFAMFDRRIISPSGYELEMDRVAPFVYGAFISPPYRLKGLHLHMLAGAYGLSEELGSPELFGEVQYMNTRSLRSYRKAGFDVYRSVRYVQLLGRKFFFESGAGAAEKGR